MAIQIKIHSFEKKRNQSIELELISFKVFVVDFGGGGGLSEKCSLYQIELNKKKKQKKQSIRKE